MRFTIETEMLNREQKELRAVPKEERLLHDVEKLLDDPHNLIGEGRTSEVREMKGNPNWCLKIIDDERLEQMYGLETPTFNTEEMEFELLGVAHRAGESVKIPRPLLAWKIKTERGRGIGVIVMERLQAITLKEIHEGARPSRKFQLNAFFESLYRYLERLHDDFHIHHRDIAEGNILIEETTGMPCLVDFGDAIKTTEGENPFTVRDDFGRVIRSYRNDLKALAEIRKRLAAVPSLTSNIR